MANKTFIIGPTEAARLLGVTLSRVRQLRGQGLPSIETGPRRYVFDRLQVLEFRKIPRRKSGRPRKDVL